MVYHMEVSDNVKPKWFGFSWTKKPTLTICKCMIWGYPHDFLCTLTFHQALLDPNRQHHYHGAKRFSLALPNTTSLQPLCFTCHAPQMCSATQRARLLLHSTQVCHSNLQRPPGNTASGNQGLLEHKALRHSPTQMANSDTVYLGPDKSPVKTKKRQAMLQPSRPSAASGSSSSSSYFRMQLRLEYACSVDPEDVLIETPAMTKHWPCCTNGCSAWESYNTRVHPDDTGATTYAYMLLYAYIYIYILNK